MKKKRTDPWMIGRERREKMRFREKEKKWNKIKRKRVKLINEKKNQNIIRLIIFYILVNKLFININFK